VLSFDACEVSFGAGGVSFGAYEVSFSACGVSNGVGYLKRHSKKGRVNPSFEKVALNVPKKGFRCCIL